MKLSDLINNLDVRLTGNGDMEITGLTVDSRTVDKDMCFIAIPGTKVDGNHYIAQAVDNGAVAIVSERERPGSIADNIAWLRVQDAHQAAGLLGAAWNSHPSRYIKTIGVTGTNGKTTTTFIIHSILRKVWQRAGLIGTVHCETGTERIDSSLTTPAPLDLQNLLGVMASNGCRGVAMEVSSQALSQQRTAGIEFDVGVFTNLTQDHLDYHHDMEEYFLAKASLFEQMASQPRGNKKPVALINIDDPYGRRLADMYSQRMTVRTYGFSLGTDFRISARNMSVKGSEYELIYKNKSYLVRVPLIGRFNIYNSAAALAACVCAGIPVREAVACMPHCPQVPGRLELVASRCGVQAFVDYAHTPDALDNVCKTLKELATRRLITVFGCGGDRDAGKRPKMGAAANRWSDICIVTSDNPRTESPAAIIRQILQGMPEGTASIADRAEAIETAVQLSRKGDILLVAGKGHENYQELAGGRIDFHDGSHIRRALMAKENELTEKFNKNNE